MAKKLSVKIDGKKFKDGDTVAVVIVGKVRVSPKHTWNARNTQEVFVEYGDEHEFYLTDAENGATRAQADGITLVKAE